MFRKHAPLHAIHNDCIVILQALACSVAVVTLLPNEGALGVNQLIKTRF